MTASTQLPLASAHWRKSSYSNWNNQCVEVAQVGATIAVRDSKTPTAARRAGNPRHGGADPPRRLRDPDRAR